MQPADLLDDPPQTAIEAALERSELADKFAVAAVHTFANDRRDHAADLDLARAQVEAIQAQTHVLLDIAASLRKIAKAAQA